MWAVTDVALGETVTTLFLVMLDTPTMISGLHPTSPWTYSDNKDPEFNTTASPPASYGFTCGSKVHTMGRRWYDSRCKTKLSLFHLVSWWIFLQSEFIFGFSKEIYRSVPDGYQCELSSLSGSATTESTGSTRDSNGHCVLTHIPMNCFFSYLNNSKLTGINFKPQKDIKHETRVKGILALYIYPCNLSANPNSSKLKHLKTKQLSGFQFIDISLGSKLWLSSKNDCFNRQIWMQLCFKLHIQLLIILRYKLLQRLLKKD